MPGADRDIHAIEDENALRAIFAIFDANGDGLLQRDEVETFAAAFRKPNSPKGCDNVDKIMESMDFANGDGTIQFPEFEAYIKAVLDARFAGFDQNEKGYLELDDMIDVVSALIDPASKAAKKDKHFKQHKKKWFIKQFDKVGGDNDGKVSKDEFRGFFLREMHKELDKWSKNPKKELPYMLRAAVNVNPGQVSKQVRQLEKIHDETVAEQKKAGKYVPPEEEVYDLTDVQDRDEMAREQDDLVQEKTTERNRLTQQEKDALDAERKKVHTVKGGVYEEACCSACVVC